MKTLAYCRVSSLGQAEHGQSLEAQQAGVARYCARHLRVVRDLYALRAAANDVLRAVA